MTELQIKIIIKGYIDDALAGMDKENPKLDFKTKWYDLKKDQTTIWEHLLSRPVTHNS